jgi:tetratricopeptide (TPR) repeat protein
LAIDRESSLRRAEKLLRQGRLDGAIAEYLRVVEDQPNDWNTANLLGDLFVRAGQMERALAQYTRIADHFAVEGFLPKAIALYRKILKLQPTDEHALLQSAAIGARQGLLADAKANLSTVIDQRLRRGDRRGAADVALKLSDIDPADPLARLQGARASIELGDRGGAIARFRDAAAELSARGRHAEAVSVLHEAVQVDAGNAGVRAALLAALLDAGEIDRARQFASGVEDLKTIAASLATAGKQAEALDVLGEVVRQDPGDTETRTRLVRTLGLQNEWSKAAGFLPEDPGDDVGLLVLTAEVAMHTGRRDEGRALLDRALARDAKSARRVLGLAFNLAPSDPESGLACVDAVVSRAIDASDWGAAAGALEEYLSAAPGFVPALNRLVEIAMDGEMDGRLLSAQSALCDAHLEAGQADQARVIAEDLAARESANPLHVERWRRALTMIGEPDPDAIIRDHLAERALFADSAVVPEDESVATPRAREETPSPRHEVEDDAAQADADQQDVYQLSDAGIDLGEMFGDEVENAQESGQGPVEIDLSDALGDLQTAQRSLRPSPRRTPGAEKRPDAQKRPEDLDGVFDELRQEVGRDRSAGVAEQHYRLAVTYQEMGMVDEAIKALLVAARSPRHRFEAAALLGRLYRECGMAEAAVEWFEHAAEAPASSIEAGHALMYDLGEMLERAGESARALAVFLELRIDAGEYRDVAARIGRLSRAQSGD